MINKNKAVQRSCKVYKLSLFVIFLFTSLEFSPFNGCYYVQYTAITVPGISQKNICNIKSFDGWLILTERNHLNFLPLQPIKSCFKKTSPQFCPITTRKAGSGRRRHVEQQCVWSLITQKQRTASFSKSERVGWLVPPKSKETEIFLEALSLGGFKISSFFRGKGERTTTSTCFRVMQVSFSNKTTGYFS